MKHKQVIADNPKRQDVEDMRDLEIMTDRGSQPQEDYSCEDYANVRVIFDRHKEALLEYIHKHDNIIGCVAWLTDYDILEALAKKEFVSIIVQKEDFLRPDIDSSRERVRQLYELLPSSDRFRVNDLSELSSLGDPTLEPIRCVGNHNKDKKPAFPRMHHKFLVFTDHLTIDEKFFDEEFLKSDRKFPSWSPSEKDCVWTGSYNISRTASRSWENAVVLQSSKIVRAYVNEWAQIVALSEPLDWETPWSSPEWRIGT